MQIDADTIKWAVMVLVNIGATFGAIRARLNAMDKRDDSHEKEIARAHERIDSILSNQR